MDQPEPDPAALERCVEGIKYRVWWRAGSWATEMGSPAADIHTQCHSDEWEPVLRVTITFPAGS